MVENWDELVHKLPPSLPMLGRIVSICICSFTREKDIENISKFFSQRNTKGFEQALAQSLDFIKAKASWLGRDREDIADWVATYDVKSAL